MTHTEKKQSQFPFHYKKKLIGTKLFALNYLYV